MKKFSSAILAMALSFGASYGVHANGISGEISFGSTFTPANGSFQVVSIGVATSIDYNGDHVKNSKNVIVTDATGDFAADGIVADSTFGTVYDFVFNPLNAVGADVWRVFGQFGDSYTFKLTSVVIDAQTSNTLSLVGTGYVYGENFDDTVGTWHFSASPNGSRFFFGTGSAVTPVPEPEIYAMMAAGLGLMGFVARRRQRNGVVA